jgi:hypothetical protein
MKARVLFIGACLAVVAAYFAYTHLQTVNAAKQERVLRHLVMFKFKDSVTPAQIKEAEEAFCALPGKIPVIHSFEWGTNNSPEKLDQGYTHCFQLTFLSEEDRSFYLPHPAHKEFGKLLGPYVDKICVFDYWATEIPTQTSK